MRKISAIKHFLFVFSFLFSYFCLTAQEVEINGCYISSFHDWGGMTQTHEFEVYGNVYVETDPLETIDFKVKIVNSEEEATYKVFKTTGTPQKCGEWRFVTDRSKAKFIIRYVKDWEDCRIYFITDRSKAGFF